MTEKEREIKRARVLGTIGWSVHAWSITVRLVEYAIIRFMGVKLPAPKGLNSFLYHVSDRQKIDMLLTLYHDNPQYHHLISYGDIQDKLNAGLVARNYFAHTVLDAGTDGKIYATVKINKKDPQPGMDLVPDETIKRYQEDIKDAMEFMENFVKQV